ncbi:MAG: patatin-like phospholipase family protein [Hyphomicrobium sp.]
MLRTKSGALIAIAALALSACAPPIARNGITDAKLAQVAEARDLPGVRFWADEIPADPIAEIKRRTPHMPPIGRFAKQRGGARSVVETLALSGGGADGAFGAGLLTGWTARGDRPEFEVVTGVSAGAIIAPFAYLGPSEDEKLKRIWTEYRASDVVTAQIIPGLFGGQALTDTTPLANLVAQYIDHATLRRIAAEYNRGRILMVLTTNLDAQRPVVWNMGEIARVGTDDALDMFRKVILASAAIPGAFPPVNIPVTANGKAYEELHVDGGTTREIFVLPVQAPFRAFDALYAQPPLRKLYLVKNGKLNPEQEIVTQSTLPIAGRAIATLIKSQNWSELYRLYRLAKDDGADFNLAYVPAAFTHTTEKIYDPEYQKALFAEGVTLGRNGAWSKSPPGQTPIFAQKSRGPKGEADARPSVDPPPLKPDPAPPAASDSPSTWTPRIIPGNRQPVAAVE